MLISFVTTLPEYAVLSAPTWSHHSNPWLAIISESNLSLSYSVEVVFVCAPSSFGLAYQGKVYQCGYDLLPLQLFVQLPGLKQMLKKGKAGVPKLCISLVMLTQEREIHRRKLVNGRRSFIPPTPLHLPTLPANILPKIISKASWEGPQFSGRFVNVQVSKSKLWYLQLKKISGSKSGRGGS